jgi:hypothetical protein
MPTISRTVRTVVPVAATFFLAAGLSGCSSQDITKERLDRSLPVVFTNVYIQQQADIGRPGITAAKINAHNVSCDKGGPTVKDAGAGNDWICLMDFTNGAGIPQPQTRFEVKANSNGCYQVSSSTKTLGTLVIDNPSGRYFINKVSEFDGCFDTTD